METTQPQAPQQNNFSQSAANTSPSFPPSQPPRKRNPLWKVFLALFALLIVLGVSVNLYFEFKKKTATPSSSNQSLQSTTNASAPLPQTNNKLLLYAKKTGGELTTQREWPAITVYAYDTNTKQKTALFTTGSKDNYPSQIILLPARKQILVNLEHTLTLYDGKTGNIKTIYQGDKKTDFITGNALSNDNQKLAFNVTTGMYTTGEQKDNLYIINLDTNQSQRILTRNRAATSGLFSGWLSPTFWSTDDKVIIMNYTAPKDGPAGMAEITANGSTFQNIDDINTSGIASTDRKSYAYTQPAAQPTEWACQDNGMNTIKLYTFANNTETTIASDSATSYTVKAWSPDSTQLLYQAQKYQSGNGCDAQFASAQNYLFDQKTQQSKLVSLDEKLKDWNNNIVTEIANDGKKLQLLVNGQAVDSSFSEDQLFTIGILN